MIKRNAVLSVIFTSIFLLNTFSIAQAANIDESNNSRYRGSMSSSFSIYDSYDRTYSSTWQTAADEKIGEAASALVQTEITRLGDDNSKSYANLKRYSLGFVQTGTMGDVRVWLDQYQANKQFTGYRLNGQHVISEQTTASFEYAKTPVVDLDTLTAAEPVLMNDSYNLSVSHNFGNDKQFYAGMTRGRYSDGNTASGYTLQFAKTMFATGRDSLQYSAYWSRSNWEKVSEWYGNPLTSKSYGLTLNYRVNDGEGYWLTSLNGVWGADDDNPLEFWPSLQLEYGYSYSPHHSLVLGAAYGLRTDNANDLQGLRHNYRQFSLSYQADW